MACASPLLDFMALDKLSYCITHVHIRYMLSPIRLPSVFCL